MQSQEPSSLHYVFNPVQNNLFIALASRIMAAEAWLICYEAGTLLADRDLLLKSGSVFLEKGRFVLTFSALLSATGDDFARWLGLG